MTGRTPSALSLDEINPMPSGATGMSVAEHILGAHEDDADHATGHDAKHDRTPLEKKDFEKHLHDIKHGALHKMLHVPVGQDIPAEKLEQATHSSDKLLRERATMAEAMRHWSHGHSSPHDEHLGVK